jgi:hypothetical protein
MGGSNLIHFNRLFHAYRMQCDVTISHASVGIGSQVSHRPAKLELQSRELSLVEDLLQLCNRTTPLERYKRSHDHHVQVEPGGEAISLESVRDTYLTLEIKWKRNEKLRQLRLKLLTVIKDLCQAKPPPPLRKESIKKLGLERV